MKHDVGGVWCSFQNAVMKDFFMLLLRHHNEINSWLHFTSAIYTFLVLYWSKIAKHLQNKFREYVKH